MGGWALEKMAAKSCLEEEMEFLRNVYPNPDEFSWDGTTGSGSINVHVDTSGSVNVRLKWNDALYRSTLRVNHLPPIRLDFSIGRDYPESEAPEFTLSCCWLNFTTLGRLCKLLDASWSPGAVSLFDWATLLSCEGGSLLEGEEYCFEVEDPADVEDWDVRAVQDVPDLAALLPRLVEYDRERCSVLFSEQRVACCICYTTQSGTMCRKVPGCGHVFCVQCLESHIMSRIGAGLIAPVCCPGMDCSQVLPHGMVQELLPAPEFARFDQLLLQRSLDCMDDVVYCPRPLCRHPNLKDKKLNMAICDSCKYCFCTLCQKAWHGAEAGCDIPQDMFEDIRDQYEAGTAEEKAALEKQYGKKLRQMLEQLATSKWLQSNAKRCPWCGVFCDKCDGCNKMTCGSCGGYFCWLCLERLGVTNPYRHFAFGRGGCAGRLFEGLVDLPPPDDEE